MRALLAVHVLLALLDRDHVDHGAARAWLDREIEQGWASCPITENGFVRVVSHARYPSPIPVSEAVALLGAARSGPRHAFWPCDVSLLDGAVVDAGRVHGSRAVTDAYLLALAVAHDGRFVTFGGGLDRAAVPGAAARHLTVLPPAAEDCGAAPAASSS